MINYFKYFVTLVETKSVTKTSQIHGVSQPAITLAIQKLEGIYHTKLFYRDGKRFYLTKTGKYLSKEAKKIVQTFNDTKTLIDLHVKAKNNEVSIGMIDNIALKFSKTDYFTDLIKNPKIKLNLYVDSTTNLLHLLMKGTISLVICVHTYINEDEFIIKEFGKEKFVFASKIGFYESQQINLEQKLVGYNVGSNTQKLIEKFLNKHLKQKYSFVLHSNSPEVIISQLLNGFYGFIPENLYIQNKTQLSNPKMFNNSLYRKFLLVQKKNYELGALEKDIVNYFKNSNES